MRRRSLNPRSLCWALLAAFALLVVGASCRPARMYSGPPENIRLAYTSNFNSVLALIGLEKGFFKDEGLLVEAQPYSFGKLALQAVIEDKADIATAADTPAMFAVMDNSEIVILAAIETATRNEAIVARRDRGISKPADLRGKRIGVTRGTAGDFFADVYLLDQGIRSTEVTYVDMVPDDMEAALEAGSIDAAQAWNPVLTKLELRLGEGGIAFYGEMLYSEAFCLIATREFTRRRPEAVERALRVFVRAEEFVREEPDESRRLVAGFLELDRALVDEAWGVFSYKVTLDQPLLVGLEDQARWALKNRLTKRKGMPNFLEYLYLEGLHKVKPDALRIIR